MIDQNLTRLKDSCPLPETSPEPKTGFWILLLCDHYCHNILQSKQKREKDFDCHFPGFTYNGTEREATFCCYVMLD